VTPFRMPFAPMFRLYRSTIDKLYWGRQYLNEPLFELLRQRWRERLCFMTARRDGALVAGHSASARTTCCTAATGLLRGGALPALQSLLLRRHRVLPAEGIMRFEPGPVASSSTCAASTRARRKACTSSRTRVRPCRPRLPAPRAQRRRAGNGLAPGAQRLKSTAALPSIRNARRCRANRQNRR